jgi:uncharacterized phage-associated protein
MITSSFDATKSLNSLLFIANEISKYGYVDKYATLKILYFAEKKHLSIYGRLITDDKFAALNYGPVPSNSYDILDNPLFYGEYFDIVDNKKFTVKTKPNLDYLSESDIECLIEAISENKDLDFQSLMIKSHDAAYHEAFDNGLKYLDIEKIASQEGADSSILGYIKEYYEAQQIVKCLPA